MKVLLLTPPFIQTNSPYPATAYLASYLRSQNRDVSQADLSIELHLALFSSQGLKKIRNEIQKNKKKRLSESVSFFLDAFSEYQETIDPVIQFLQGKNPSLAEQITARSFLPEGPRFLHFQQHQEKILSLFEGTETLDLAQYLASLYLDDLYDVIRQGIDSDFGFSNYAESLATSQVSYEPLRQKLKKKENLIERMFLDLFQKLIRKEKPDLIGFSIPFAGNFYAALKMSDDLKRKKSKIKTVFGGGYISTELRGLQDKRVFESLDYLIYDDGERPLDLLIQHLEKKIPAEKLLRTKYLEENKIIFQSNPEEHDVAFKGLKTPMFQDLPLEKYFSMTEVPNPMRKMWTGYRWNKMILAHGCYWKRCSFCDVNLDYIGRFEAQKAETIVDQIEDIIRQTGSTGFHFVDEAAPPALLRQMSKEILRRGLQITWWGNLRFDPQFDDELIGLMAKAGCLAVTGGIEVASPRLLKLINKGLTIEQVAQVTHCFKAHGIFVHAYLMYGFPSQTEVETVESLEVVRQLFQNQCLDSGYWHRFVATLHSPVGKNPEKYGIRLRPFRRPREGLFSEYSVPFQDSVYCDHDMLGKGLNKAIYNYMHGIGVKEKVEVWFDRKVAKTKLPKNYIQSILKE